MPTSRVPQLHRARCQETVCCHLLAHRYTLNLLAARCAPSFAHAGIIYAILTSVVQIAILTRRTMRHISLDNARSTRHASATGECWIDWKSFRSECYRNALAHFRRNRHLDRSPRYAHASQRHISNLIWNSTFPFILFCRSKIIKILYLLFAATHVYQTVQNAWLRPSTESCVNTLKKKLWLQNENLPN